MSAATVSPWPIDASAATARPKSRLGTRAGRRFVTAAIAAGVLSALFIAWTALRIGGDTVTIGVDDIGEAVAALVAAVSCGYAAWRNAGRMRLAWGLLGGSALAWFIGEVIWSVYEVGLGVNVPFPSAADAGYLLAIPLAVAGMLAFPSAPGRLTTRSQALVDGAIVALSLVFVSWALGLGKVYETSSDQPLAQLLGAAYPASDVVIIAVLLLVIRRASPQQRGAMFLLLGGLAANSIADSAFAFLNAAGTYGAIGSVLDAGWVVGYLMVALAPLWPAPFAGAVGEEGPVDFWQMSVPWVSLFAAATVALVLAVMGRGLDVLLTAIGGGLGMLLVASMVLLHRDTNALLSVRDRTEAQLEQRTEMLNQVISHAPLGVARVGVDLRILDANPRLGSLLHAPAKIMVGSMVADYLSAEELGRLIERTRPLWEGEVDTVEGDSPTRRADGSEVWLHWSVTSVRKTNGKIDYFLAMFEDITAKHEAEETAMANLAGLERLNQLKSEFVSMVSHEFRTALVGIQGFSEILRDESIGADEVKGLATDINKDAQRLNRMIGEMLDLDRMEAGKIRLTTKPVDLNALIKEVIERAQVSSERHAIRTDLDQALPIVTADPDRLVQVVSNLLSNAIKYSPDGGEVGVATRAEDGMVHVSVKDQGIGIAPEFVNRLFGRYERFESNRTSQVVGTGLGLAISRQIVELHGGRIWVDSRVGAGSNFQFTVPVRAIAGV
ncbi:MAG TPA: PAS domain-containing sensor histidine kinase [Candidatus Dormibacteraeota bacterium]|nr:PAS domain-containing sensor histidine kinase [Candidatus Dormibacteraeota bacterium]